MPRASKLTERQKQQIRQQHLSGRSCRDLAQEYQVSAMSISRVVRPDTRPDALLSLPYAPPVQQVMGRIVLMVLDPELWDVDQIQQRYAVDYAEASAWHTYVARHIRLMGYQHLMLWSDEQDSPALARMLAHKAGLADRTQVVYARNCQIQTLPDDQAHEFYTQHHLQGPAGKGRALHLALVWRGRPVACMSFAGSHVCRGLPDHHLLQRYACAVHVPGGASRLLRSFRHQHPGPIISYSDERYAPGGQLYRLLGFEVYSRSRPDYRYWKSGRWYAKSSKQRRNLVQEGGNPDLTEREMAKELGYKRCYDLGKLTWRLA